MGRYTQYLQTAADIVNRNGLHSGSGRFQPDPTNPDAPPPPTAPVSVHGAIRLAITGTASGLANFTRIGTERLIYDVTWHVQDYLHATYGRAAANLTAWESAPARTTAQATAMLRSCATWNRPAGFATLR